MWMSWRRGARNEYSGREMELMAAWLSMLRLAALGCGGPAIAEDWGVAVDWGTAVDWGAAYSSASKTGMYLGRGRRWDPIIAPDGWR